jgi:FPC/CPF motif-containing protein YcgG
MRLSYCFLISLLLNEQRFKQFIWSVRLNAFTIQPKNPVQLYNDMEQQVNSDAYQYSLTGSGVYPMTSFLNHSCNFNCIVAPNYLDYR